MVDKFFKEIQKKMSVKTLKDFEKELKQKQKQNKNKRRT